MGFIAKLIGTAAGFVASYYVTKWIDKRLEERSLDDRLADAKEKVINLQVKALDKKSQLVDQARDKANAVLDKAKEWPAKTAPSDPA